LHAVGSLSGGSIPPAAVGLKFQDILIELETASISDIRIERTLKDVANSVWTYWGPEQHEE